MPDDPSVPEQPPARDDPAARASPGSVDLASFLLRPHTAGDSAVGPGPSPDDPSSAAILRGEAAVADGTADPESAPNIGRYRLLKVLGKGGFGMVWQAEQTEPIHREVALKIIKPGMDSHEIIARFEAERQALALMDHPNIAAVLDAGTTERGRPYFVMELVKGVPITEYCDAHKLGIRARLELFIQVCQGVQHAHQKAILHRDLKPSNILVSEVDGRAVPKVIDFGIAKALGGSREEIFEGGVTLTREGMAIGTPQYMSPEQAGTARDVDTRSDIYTLGVILYELLTGGTPLSPEELFAGGLDQVLGRIREGETERPSSRFVPRTEAVQRIAAARGTDPKRLRATLHGDLDWIVLKALEKERERRYETANALARDLGRYLRCEPVSASPPSTGYRLKKLIQRNRLAFGAALGIGLALVGGIVTSTWQAVRARHAERLSGERLAQTEKAREEAEKARDAAENLVTDAIFGLGEKLLPIGKIYVLDDMEKAAEDYYANLPPELSSSTTRHHQVRLVANRALIAGMRSDDDASEEAGLAALALARKFAAEHPDDLRFLEDEVAALELLGLLRVEQDAPEEAGVFSDEACQVADLWLQRDPKATRPLNVKLGAEAQRMIAMGEQGGNLAEALPIFAKMRALADQLEALDKVSIETALVDALGKLEHAGLMSKVGNAKLALPADREAEAAFAHALQAFGEHPVTRQLWLVARGHTIGDLRKFAAQTGDATLQAEAERTQMETLHEREKLTEQEPLRLDWWKELALSYGDYIKIVEARDGPAAALAWAEKAFAAGEKAASPHCDRARFRAVRVTTRVALARLLRKVRPVGWAERTLKLLAETPEIEGPPLKHGHLYMMEGDHYDIGLIWSEIVIELDRPERAAETLRQFRALLAARRTFIAIAPTDAKLLRDGIDIARRLAHFLEQNGRPGDAAEFDQQWDQWKKELLARFPSDPAIAFYRLSAASDRCTQAINDVRSAPAPRKAALFGALETEVKAARALLEESRPQLSNDDYARYRITIENVMGTALLEAKRYPEAEVPLRAALDVRNAALAKAKNSDDLVQMQWDRTEALLKLGLVVYQEGRLEEGRKMRSEGAEVREKIAHEHPTAIRFRDCGTAWQDVAELLATHELAADRVAALEKGVALHRESLRLAKGAAGATPTELDSCRGSAGWALLNLGYHLHDMKRLTEAEAPLREGVAVCLERVAAAPGADSGRIRQLLNLRYDLAKTLLDLQRPEEAQAQVDAMVAEVRVFEDPAGHALPEFDETRRRLVELRGRLSPKPANQGGGQ